MSTEKNNDKNPAAASVKAIKKSDQITKILESAKDSPQFANFSDEQKEIAIEIVKGMFDRFPTLDFPKQNDDGSIEMDLMDGSHIHITAPKCSHVITAQRDMETVGEKGDKDDMLPIYTMAACSNIDGEPVSVLSMGDKLTARDFKNLIAYFRSSNLL
jgi:hypothetical protein